MTRPIYCGSITANIPIHPILRVATSGVLARAFTTVSAGTGAMVGALAEGAAFVTRYALEMITANQALLRTAERGARLLGGYYLGSLTGWAPVAFAPTAVLLTLGSLAIAYLTVETLNDIFQAAPSFQITSQRV